MLTALTTTTAFGMMLSDKFVKYIINAKIKKKKIVTKYALKTPFIIFIKFKQRFPFDCDFIYNPSSLYTLFLRGGII